MSRIRALAGLIASAGVTASLLLGAATANATPAAPASPAAANDPAVVAQHITTENQTLVPSLLARGGKVTADKRFVVMPDHTQVSLAPMQLSDCPTGWVCLFESANWTGRLLKWSDPGTRADLSSYGFNDQMTSWANKGPYDAAWFYNAGFSGTGRCMQPNSTSSYVGATDNDKASSFAIYTDSLAC